MSIILDKPLVYADSIPGGYQEYLQDFIKPLPWQRRKLIKMLEEHLSAQPDDYTSFIAELNGIRIVFKNHEEQLSLNQWLSNNSPK